MTNIYLTCFHFKEIIFHTIDRIKQTIKYPHRIIVSENLSENSKTIRERLNFYLELNKINKIYTFNNNSRLNRLLCIKDDLKQNPCDFITISDQDAYIEEGIKQCWLKEFTNLLNNKTLNIGAVAFSSYNQQWRMEKIKQKYSVENNAEFTIFYPNNFQDWDFPFNEHLLTMKQDYLQQLISNEEWIDDRKIHNFNHKNLKNSARFNKHRVFNLSCVSIFNKSFDNLNLKIKREENYEDLRKDIRKTNKIKAGEFHCFE